MKAHLLVNPKLRFEVEAKDQKDMFGQLAEIEEIFSEGKCRKCGKTNIKFIKRTIEDNDYYELQCKDCYAKLAFGAHKKGNTLFPKRKDADGNWLPNGGWTIWTGKKDE